MGEPSCDVLRHHTMGTELSRANRKPEGGRKPTEPQPVQELEPGQTRREVEGVFLRRAATAVFTPVELGISGDRYFEVLSGIEEGDQVVSGSYEALRDLTDGAPVKIEEAAASSEGS